MSEYLGDGLYVLFDGCNVCLYSKCENDEGSVDDVFLYFDPAALGAFLNFIDRTKVRT